MRFGTFGVSLLFAILWSALPAPTPLGAQPPPEHDVSSGVRIARPRGAILTLFDSGAESFLRDFESNAERPRAHPAGAPLRLYADYEAVLLPLTAGFARFELAAFEITDGGPERLAADRADVVAFGPARRAGRLGFGLDLEPGLHHIGLVATTRTRAVGVSEWTVDTDESEIWVLVGAPAGTPLLGDSAPSIDEAPLSPDRTDQLPAIALPVGGLGVGAQRGIAAESAVGALNFGTGANSVLRTTVGRSVRIWTDYELWWTDGAWAASTVELSIRQTVAPVRLADVLATDRAHFGDGVGPRLEDGALQVGVSFDHPGTYHLAAQLTTIVQRGADVSRDVDSVPFTIEVVGVPPTTGDISGRVLGAGADAPVDSASVLLSEPLEGVTVIAYARAGHAAGRARTNAEGHYRLEGLDPGDYFVRAAPAPMNFLDQWWRGSPSRHGATPVTVAAGGTTDGIMFRLSPGATIAGRVTDSAGRPLGGIEITLGPIGADGSAIAPRTPSDPSIDGHEDMLERARTNDEGHYAIDRLPAGGYWVRARDPEGRYLTEYFDDALLFDEAEPVKVIAGMVVDEVDFELALGGAITGQVREQTELRVIIPLPRMLVEARSTEDPERIVASAVSGDDGRYRLGALRPGRYLVTASAPSGSHAREWFQEAANADEATPVGVMDGEVTPDVHFTLSPAERKTVVFVDPEHQVARAGVQGRFAIHVADVENLGAFEAVVEWDPAVLAVDAVEIGDFLGSTGRDVIPVTPMIDNDAGRLTFAAASLGDRPAPSGGGALFDVRFTPRAGGESRLILTGTILTGPSGRDIPHATEGGSIRVGGCMVGDFDCNCRIDIRDVMAVVVRWGMTEGDPDWDPLYDLHADGRINIVDVQIVAALWGTVCPTDAAPLAGAEGWDRADDTVRSGDSDRSVDADRSGVSELEGSDRPDGSALVDDGSDLARDERATPIDTLTRLAGSEILISADQTLIQVGERVTIALDAMGAVDLAAFEATIEFDPERLVFVEATLGDFLGSTGRSVTQLGPHAGHGTVSVAAFSMPGAPAPSGNGRLATITFQAVAEGTAGVRVRDGAMVDSLNETTTVAGGAASVEVGRPSARTDAFVPFVTRGR